MTQCDVDNKQGAVDHAIVYIFFFNDTATTEIYTLSLHDALPIFITRIDPAMKAHIEYFQAVDPIMIVLLQVFIGKWRSEEHTSELQSH